MAGAGRGEAVMVAVTPLPAMATVGAPAPAGWAPGHVMTTSEVGLQTLQETVVKTNPGGTAAGVYWALSPVHVSVMVYVAIHWLVGQAAWRTVS